MGYKHVLLEVYCGYEYREDKNAKEPHFCKLGVNNPGYHCFANECIFKSYTQCSNEFAYVSEHGEVMDETCYVGFGGEMESVSDSEFVRKKQLKLWENICKKKINEAYDEYMVEKNKKSKKTDGE